MAKGVKTGGRVKGTPNKLQKEAKEAIQEVFDALGGTAGLEAYARSNPEGFYERIWVKIIPKDIKADLKVTKTLEDIISGEGDQ